MFRVGIILNTGEVVTQNFDTKPEAENWILEVSEKQKVKRADILDKTTEARERVF